MNVKPLLLHNITPPVDYKSSSRVFKVKTEFPGRLKVIQYTVQLKLSMQLEGSARLKAIRLDRLKVFQYTVKKKLGEMVVTSVADSDCH